ncbi:MAG: redoxin family protein [Phycisphaerae bacterium]
MNRKPWCGVVTLVLAWVCAPVVALDLGDVAPPLTIAEWVQGKSIESLGKKKDKLHLVEFWAVWCPPCKMSIPRLTDLQKKYDKDLVIVGVTVPDNRGNNPDAIRKFCKDQGDEMAYAVAIDKSQATSNAYMRSSNIMGIPFAFLVDREGRVAWMGSPLDPELDSVVGRVASGDYDVDRAKIEAVVQERLQRVLQAAQYGQPEIAREGLVDILKLDPANDLAMEFLMNIHVDALGDRAGFRKWVESHIDEHGDDAVVMTNLAWTLCAIPKLADRSPDLALDAASKAYQASKSKDPSAISIYAKAVYQLGDLDKAIALQESAVEAADGKNDRPFRDILEHYKRCRDLKSSVN